MTTSRSDARSERSVTRDVPGEDDTLVPAVQERVAGMLRPILRRWLDLTVEGREHVPTAGPVILAGTHQSHADSLAIGTAVPRPTHFLGDRRLMDWPLVGRWLPRMGMVPLHRGGADASAMQLLARLLEDAACIVIYPEGSRSRDGRVHRLRSGLGRLASATSVPVVPVAVAGIHDVWPIGRRPRLRGGKVTVRFGPQLDPPAPTAASRRDFNLQLQGILAELAGTEVATDFSPIHGGVDPDAPDGGAA
jgi:1-acyl-sn-glycerol-3-phosphate acyltransferase